jgi:hypothetical protein
MTSLQTRIKQIPANDGYYIGIASCRDTFYVNAGTDSAPQISTNLWARSTNTSTILNTAGCIFRDMGKTVTSTGRVFRKVQLLVSSPFSEGVAGQPLSATNLSDYLSGFIELPGTGGMSSGFGNGAGAAGPFTPVARLG